MSIYRPSSGPLGTTSSGKIVHNVTSSVYTSRVGGRKGAHFALRRQLPDWTKEDHAEAAEFHENEAEGLRDQHSGSVSHAEARYGAHGPLISGGLREHWPPRVKDAVRTLAQKYPQHQDAARAHRAAMRFRSR